MMESVCIERMMQRSSAIFAVCGRRSLIQAPLRPYWENLNGEPAMGMEL